MHSTRARSSWFIVEVFAVLFTLSFSAQARAFDMPRVLLIGVDGVPEAMFRDQRPFLELSDDLAAELSETGYRVFMEDAVAEGAGRKTRVRRTTQQTLEAVENLPDRALDYAVLLTVRHDVEHSDGHILFALKVVAQIVDATQGEVLETLKIKSSERQIDKDYCNAMCLRRAAARSGETLAPYLAERLMEEFEALEDERYAALSGPRHG